MSKKATQKTTKEETAETPVIAAQTGSVSETAPITTETPKAIATETPKPVTATQTESQTVAPVTTELSAKKAKNFTAYVQPEVAYSEEAALDLLRQKLRGYKEIHPGFLAKTEEKDAFIIKREYLLVYRQSAVVDYAWTIKNKGEKTTHTERREVSCRQHTAPAFFRADSFPQDVKTITLASPKKAEELYPCKPKTFSFCVDALKKEAKAYAPQKAAKMQFYNRAYEIFYVPVLKAVCTFEGKEYVGYVNMLNGECEAQYRVSDKLLNRADKTIAAVKSARRTVVSAFVYALTFVALGWYNAYLKGTIEKNFVLLIATACALIVPLFVYLFSFSYKRNKLILKGVQTGKQPKSTLLKIFALLSLLVALGEMLIFAIYLMA